MESRTRIDYIDYAKGIGILLMVIGHYEYLNQYVENWIFSFTSVHENLLTFPEVTL